MDNITDTQLQTFSDNRIRVRAEALRALIISFEDDLTSMDSITTAIKASQSTWQDSRTDGPPTLLTANDISNYLVFLNDVIAAIKQHPNYPTIQKACVRAL